MAESSAQEADLKSALEAALHGNGVLSEVKARIRAEAFLALNDKTKPCPAVCRENLILNELIREYLEFNQYSYTAVVLDAESGHTGERMHRKVLCRELGYPDEMAEAEGNGASTAIPLLYSVLAALLRGKEESRVQAEQDAEAEKRSEIHAVANITGATCQDPIVLQRPQ
ncbi:centrosomal protein 20-like [Sycon ciliatum]|uniref:centrosomal protein 20-like n=1 Tax=Sycon ciliatum TaxID=27933 RepID=UPI0031F5F0AB